MKIDVLGLQETKWFGREQYVVAEAVVLAAGRPIPVDNFMHGEGVALVLRSRARAAFECGGSQWRAVSSRILSCRLKWSCRESPQEDGSTWMHIIVCYAPTFRSSRHDSAVCARKFKSQTGFARHHCSRGTRVSAAERAAFEFVCGRCCCRFRRDSDLQRRLRFCS